MATRRTSDDDSEESEATALDLRPSSSLSRSSSSVAPSKQISSSNKPAVVRARAPLVDDSVDEEATEFLQARPPSARGASSPSPSSSSEPVLRATGRAVAIEGGTPPSGRDAPLSAPVIAPSSFAALPQAREARPLPQRSAELTSTSTASKGTVSRPRVTRIQMMNSTATGDDDSGLHERIDPDITAPPEQMLMAPRRPTRVDSMSDETEQFGDDDDGDPEATLAPDHLSDFNVDPHKTGDDSSVGASDEVAADAHEPRPVPNTAEGDSVPSMPARPRELPRAPRPTLEPDKPHDGVLVIDAPADASVTVNGVERGKGQVKVSELDRDARHAVRIHAPGFQPWSGSVTLQGKQAAKIRPTLKPRSR